MSSKLYVGNLAFSVTDQTLADKFAEFGTVDSAKVIMDRDSGRSKGFGFVEMSAKTEADEAINQLNGQEWEGRALKVNEAKPQEPRERSRGGFDSGRRGRF